MGAGWWGDEESHVDALQESRTVLSTRKKPLPGIIKIIFKCLKGHSEVWEDLFVVISGSTVGVWGCSYMETEASLVWGKWWLASVRAWKPDSGRMVVHQVDLLLIPNCVHWVFPRKNAFCEAKVTMKLPSEFSVCHWAETRVELTWILRHLSFRQHKHPQHCADVCLLWPWRPSLSSCRDQMEENLKGRDSCSMNIF